MEIIEGRSYYVKGGRYAGRVVKILRPSAVEKGSWVGQLEGTTVNTVVNPGSVSGEAGPKALREMFKF